MATRDLSTAKVFVGRLCEIIISDSGDDAKLELKNLKPETVTITDELKEMTLEMENGQEIVQAYGFKSTLEVTISELNTTDLTALDLCESLGEIVVKTTTGGTNATGMTFTLTDCDQIKAYNDNFKTKIVCKKATTSTTRPWTIEDNSA